MSTVAPVTAACARCGTPAATEVVIVANLDQRVELEQAVFDHQFNTFHCAHCGHRALIERTVAFVSFERSLWMLCYPLPHEPHWRDLGRAAIAQFHRNRCAIPPDLQTAPETWRVRIVFGHDQLREKFLIWRNDLDELAVEAARIALLAADPRRYTARTWLVDTSPDQLRWMIAWQPGEPTFVDTPRTLLDVPVPDGFLAEELLAHAYVNARCWTVRPIPADPLQFDLDGRAYLEGGGAALRRPQRIDD